MADALSDFLWRVAEDYRLGVAWFPPKRGFVLVAKGTPEARTYRPFSRETAMLFREFANVDTDSLDPILRFARRYGGLGGPVSIEVGIEADPDATSSFTAEAVTVHGYTWRHAIGDMRDAVGLWDAIRERQTGALVAWAKTRRSWRSIFYEMRLGAQPTSDPIQNGKEVLRGYLDAQLAFTAVGPHVVWDGSGERLRLAHVPRNLLGAMWLQLALQVTGDRTVRTCKYCDKVFEVSKEPTGARTRGDSEFCSINCKSRDYRARFGKARTLWREGRSARDIATLVATDTKTVRGWAKRWLAEKKDRKG